MQVIILTALCIVLFVWVLVLRTKNTELRMQLLNHIQRGDHLKVVREAQLDDEQEYLLGRRSRWQDQSAGDMVTVEGLGLKLIK